MEVSDDGNLRFGDRHYQCAIGHGGITANKREGDGATPVGNFPLRQVLYRPDRLTRPETRLPVQRITAQDGWCDDVLHSSYNRLIRRPFSASHEELWREDELYDLIVVVGYNDDPVVIGKGSAIFVHIARQDYSPTEGCVALRRTDLLGLLTAIGPETLLSVNGP